MISMVAGLKIERMAERTRVWLERQSALISRRLPPPPFQSALSRIEREIGDSLLSCHAREIAKIHQDFLGCLPKGRRHSAPPPRTEAMEEMAERLVTRLRVRMECVPWDRPLLGLVARLDQCLPTTAGEHMDDQRLASPVRRNLVRVLDQQTRRAGDYLVLADLVKSLYPPATDTPTSILDIASGPGGFAIAVARAARGKRNLHIVASDVDAEYLEIGKSRAEEAGILDLVEFRPIDAFRLGDELAGWRPDIVTCTRSLHHFGVRGTTRLLALALRYAVRGVLFVDIGRSISRMLMAAGAGISSCNWRFAHDAVVSVRKSFTPEELRLVAACVPGGESLEVFYTAPAYIVARGFAGGPATLGQGDAAH